MGQEPSPRVTLFQGHKKCVLSCRRRGIWVRRAQAHRPLAPAHPLTRSPPGPPAHTTRPPRRPTHASTGAGAGTAVVLPVYGVVTSLRQVKLRIVQRPVLSYSYNSSCLVTSGQEPQLASPPSPPYSPPRFFPLLHLPSLNPPVFHPTLHLHSSPADLF